MSETNGMKRPSGGAQAANRAAKPTAGPRASAAGRSGVRPVRAAGKGARGPARPAQRAAKPAAGRTAGDVLSVLKGLAGRAAGALKALGRRRPAKGKPRASLLKSRFYRVYFVLLALAVVGIAVGTVWLHGLLKDYESAQPVYVAEEVAKIFEDGDFTSLYTMDSSAQDIAAGDQTFYEDTMRGIVAGREIGWSEVFSPNEDERRYSVTVGSDKLASFTLVPSGQVTKHGNRLWQLGTLDTNVVTETELDETLGERIDFRVTAPSDCTVTVDGEALTAEDAVRTGIATLPEGFLPKGMEAPTLTQYGFTTRNENPQVTVTDASGAAKTLVEDGEHAWTCQPADDAAFRERYSEGIIKLAKQLAMFTSGDVSRGALLRNVQDGSPADDIISKFSNYWAPTHKDCEFSNITVSECVVHSDSCFTCHITFDFLLRTRRGTEMTYPTAYTFCIVKKGKGARLYNLTMN